MLRTVVLSLASLVVLGNVVASPVDLVNVLTGTYSKYSVSRGNTLPFVAVPWGMNTWAPSTTDDMSDGWWFNPEERFFYGIRCSHQPSPWISDYSHFRVSVSNSKVYSQWGWNTGYDPHAAEHLPYYYKTPLDGFHTSKENSTLEFAPTSRGSKFHFHVPKSPTGVDVPEKLYDDDSRVIRIRVALHDNDRICVDPPVEGKQFTPKKDESTFEFFNRQMGRTGGAAPKERCAKMGFEVDDHGIVEDRLSHTPEANYKVRVDSRSKEDECTGAGQIPVHDEFRLESFDPATGVLKFKNIFAHDKFPYGQGAPMGWAQYVYMKINVENGSFNCFDYSSSTLMMYYTGAPDGFDFEVGTSFISFEHAENNWKLEVEGKDIQTLADTAKELWNNEMLRVDIKNTGMTDDESDYALRVFYSNMYRTLLFPRSLDEPKLDASGSEHACATRLRMDDGTTPREEVFIGDGPFSTDSGYWDAYHTVYTLLTLVNPERLRFVYEGYLNAYDECDPGDDTMWIPQWASPGIRGSMVGTMSDTVIADAIVKGLVTGEFAERLYYASEKHAFQQPTEKMSNAGRRGLTQFNELHYNPYDGSDDLGDVHEDVSRSLLYYQANWALAQAADALSITGDNVNHLRESAYWYSSLFDRDIKMFRPKMADGTWYPDFDQYMWGRSWTECGPWQARFMAPHDAKGLALLFADAEDELQGREEACKWMEETMVAFPIYHWQGYGSVIHEMIEAQYHGIGQYAHSNQPSHYQLWMFITMFGGHESLKNVCLTNGQRWIRRVMRDLHTLDNFAGDEDNGEMGSWFVLASMGLYSVSPGSPMYQLGSPLFNEITFKYADGKDVTISAPGNCYLCYVVDSVDWNGENLPDFQISHSQLMEGGTLTFHFDNSIQEAAPECPCDSGAVALGSKLWGMLGLVFGISLLM